MKSKKLTDLIPLLDPEGSRLACRYGGRRELRRGYFCLFFILPPRPRRSLLCMHPRCCDYEQCCEASEPSRQMYDRVINYAADEIDREARIAAAKTVKK